MSFSITKVCVCGAGTMGSGIAQVTATAGFETVVYDVQEAIIQKAKTKIELYLQKLVERNKLTTEQKVKILNKIQFTSIITDCTAPLIIEAIVEKEELKVALFQQLAKFNIPETIFASNTSSLSLSSIAQQLDNAKNLIGLHFFNPAPLMQLVEVIHTPYTDNLLLSSASDFVKALGKNPVICRDAPGFIVNRIARPFYIESLRLMEENKASFETIDRLMEAQGFKMGPFKLMDLIGNDVNYAVSCSVYKQLNKPLRLQPSSIQKEKVEQGQLGRKTGKGYYEY